MAKRKRSPDLMSANDTAVLVVDVQEKLLPAIDQRDRVLARSRLALKGAKILGLPILVTEQYPKGLGHTVSELNDLIPEAVSKVCFSSCGEAKVLTQLGEWKTKNVLLVGIEAHVCVQQTAFDLLEEGYHVYIAADAVGSRSDEDKQWALRRMADKGIVITTAESAVFEWTEGADAPKFKEISQLIKESSQ